jgi:hypothetical protein
MAWLSYLGALVAFALALLSPFGTLVVLACLLLALLLMLTGTLQLLRDRAGQVASARMLDEAELGRLQAQLEAGADPEARPRGLPLRQASEQ